MDKQATATASISRSNAQGGDWITRLLLAGGMIGPALFVVVLLVEGATRPGYSAWHQFGSELGLSSQGWEQVANFLICGLFCLGFAAGLRRALGRGKGAVAGPVALAVFGVALIVAGIFKTDPGLGYPPGVPALASPTPHGAVHALAGLFAFVSLSVACFALAWRFAGDARWRGWAAYSILTGVVVVLSLVFSNVPSLSDFAGLIQRIGIIAGWAWIVLLARGYLLQTQVSATAAHSSVRQD
ncbi:MAG TPA: DUF998 domain-containing protein [Ktedonobacterales bacterium]|nr:DUF998 domain-containing protein [Ktedonobacterales bacterium]